MLKTINHSLHIAMFCLVVIFGANDITEIMLVLACFLASWAVSHAGLTFAGRRRSAEVGALSIGIVMLYWVAYVTKFGLGTFLSEQYWVVPKLISHAALVREMPAALALATVGYAALMLAVLSFPMRMGLRWEVVDFHPRTRLISVLIPLAMIGKYILKAQFNLGVPGVDPLDLGVPYLAGFLAFVVDTGFFYASNVLLFCGLALGRPKLMLFGFVLGFANAGIDMRFGSKDTAMYQLAVTLAYVAITRNSKMVTVRDFRKTARIAMSVLVVLGVAILGAYKFFNFYRFALLGGEEDIFRAISLALSSAGAVDSRSSLVEIYNRITGLETLTAVINLRDALNTSGGLTAMISTDLADSFTFYIMGTNEAKTAFSFTQFGFFYLSGGLGGLVFGCMIQGLFFCLTQLFVLRMRVHPAMKLAFFPVLWILFVQSLLGGGNMILWFKEVGVLVAVFYLTARITCPQVSASECSSSHGYHGHLLDRSF